jgi:8-oxo-dGTP pyrophosphatase MutT (NUDIX family)
LTEKEPAYGGVIFDTEGRILLREPAGNFGGLVWTFSKGRPREGETPEETALRETQEETGWSAEIVDRIPGVFSGDVTDTIYFLMRASRQVGEPNPRETSRLQWATPDEARELIRETPNPVGLKRDLAVLEAALALPPGRQVTATEIENWRPPGGALR